MTRRQRYIRAAFGYHRPLAAALTAVSQADQDVEEHISKKKRKKRKGEDAQPEPASDTLQTETKKNRRRSRNPAAAIEPPVKDAVQPPVEDAVHPPVQPPVQIAATATPAPVHIASATPAPTMRRIKNTCISDDVAADAPGCDVEPPHSALVVHGRPSTTAKAAAAASAHRITRISSVTSPQTALVPPPQQASSVPCINGDSCKEPRPPNAGPLLANSKAAPAADADSHSLPSSSMQSLQLVGVGNDVLPTKGSFLQLENDILMAAMQVR